MVCNRSLTMLKSEVLPHLVRKQFMKSPKRNIDKDLPNPDVSVVSLDTAHLGSFDFRFILRLLCCSLFSNVFLLFFFLSQIFSDFLKMLKKKSG